MRIKSLTAAALIGATLTAAAAPAPALARDYGYQGRGYQEVRYDRGYRSHDRGYYRQGYRGTSCNRSSSTTGLLLGGVAGALLGRAIDTRGERTTGTVLGAGAGALLGNEIGKNRC